MEQSFCRDDHESHQNNLCNGQKFNQPFFVYLEFHNFSKRYVQFKNIRLKFFERRNIFIVNDIKLSAFSLLYPIFHHYIGYFRHGAYSQN